MKFFSRSSRATGPKMRVPRGEADQRPVVATVGLLRPDDDRLDDLALLDRALRCRGLHGSNDHVAHTRVAPVRAAHDADAEDLARTGVVGHPKPGLLLNH